MHELTHLMLSLTSGGKPTYVRVSDISQVLPQIPQGKRKAVGSILVIDSEQSVFVDQSMEELDEVLVEAGIVIFGVGETIDEEEVETPPERPIWPQIEDTIAYPLL